MAPLNSKDFRKCEVCGMLGSPEHLDQSGTSCANCGKIKFLEETVGRLEEKISRFEERLEKLYDGRGDDTSWVKRATEVEKKLETLEKNQEVKKEVDIKKMEEKWNEVVKKNVDKKLKEVKHIVEEMAGKVKETKTMVDEDREKEKRRNNVIIHRLPESTAASEKEKRTEEKKNVMHLFTEVLQLNCDEQDIKRMFRLSKDKSGSSPLLIELKERTFKNSVMEALSKLKTAEEKFSKISVCHDMTKSEREQCKNMVELAKTKENSDKSGEFIYRVRGAPGEMRVIKIKRSQ